MCVFVYSPKYDCDIGQHVFPAVKFRLLYERLLADPEFERVRFAEPEGVSRDDLELVHTRQYADDLLNCRTTTRTVRSELPISKAIVDAHVFAAGGTVLAAEMCLKEGGAMNLNGGFHHCFPGHAEGFCYVNDVAIAVGKLQREGRIEKAAVIDCDLHQGNGTAFIFQGEPRVFTFSIHQENNYPVKQKSDLDIGLPDGTRDEEYLRHLEAHVAAILSGFGPDIVLYLAGADPYEGDQLGGLRLTMRGLMTRDEFVISQCRKRGIPVCVLVAGGYAFHTEDTVEIHHNTGRVLLRELKEEGGLSGKLKNRGAS